MRLCWFDDNRLGRIDGGVVSDVTEALQCLPSSRYPLPLRDLFISNLDEVCECVNGLRPTVSRKIEQVRLLSPVLNPGKLVAAPVNYQRHLEETIADVATFSREHVRRIQETGLFLKATSSMIGVGSSIEIRHPERRTDHEIELAVVIGRTCRNVRAGSALSYVAGYTIGLDITIRGPEERSLRKSLDSYSVLGPWLVTVDELGDPSGRELRLAVNGVVRQQANTDDLIMDVPSLIAFASSFYTLHPGDVLFTGTPEGVGPIQAGDRIEASISGIGELNVGVVSA